MMLMRKIALWLCALVLLVASGYAWWAFAELSVSGRAAPFAALILAGYAFASRKIERLPKRKAHRIFAWSLAGMVFAYIGVSLLFMRAYRFTPVFDADALFTGAQSWLEGSLTARGGPTYQAETYFYYFPNNLGAAMLLRCWFALTRGMDPYISACTLNMLLSAGMIACTGLAAREIGGAKMGLRALLLLGCTLPVWVSCAAFYTDFLSIAFPVAGLYFAYLADRRKKPWFWALSGLMAAIGAMIKITVLILPIAVVLWQLLRRKWRAAIAMALSAALLFGAGQMILQKSVYPDQLDPQIAEKMNTPVLHWVMMGLKGDGFYNGEDYEFTRSFADGDEAKEAIAGEIVRRVQNLGPKGFALHSLRKMGYALCDGTLMLSDYYDDSPIAPKLWQDLLLPGGKWYALWQTACSAVHMAQLILAICAAIFLATKGAKGLSGAMYVALFGMLVFLSLWEASRRYWINFLPILILCAAQMRFFGDKRRFFQNKNDLRRADALFRR